MKKLLFFSLAALVAFPSCDSNKDGDAEKPLTLSATSITGLPALPAGHTYEVWAFAMDSDMEPATVIAKAPLSNGGFSITLPAPPPTGTLLPPVQFDIPADDAGLKIAIVLLAGIVDEDPEEGGLIYYGSKNVFMYYVYANQAFKADGKGVDYNDGSETRTTFSLDCKAGWNMAVMVDSDNLVTTAIPSGLKWMTE